MLNVGAQRDASSPAGASSSYSRNCCLTRLAAEHLRSHPGQSNRAASTTRITAKLRDLPLQYTGLFTKDTQPTAQPYPSKAAPAAAAAPSAPATGADQQASTAAPAASQAAATARSPEPSPRPGAQGKAGGSHSRAATQPVASVPDPAAQAAAAAATSPVQPEQAAGLRSDRQPQPLPSVRHAPYDPAAPENFSWARAHASQAARRQAEAAAELEDDWGSDEVSGGAAVLQCGVFCHTRSPVPCTTEVCPAVMMRGHCRTQSDSCIIAMGWCA